MVTAVQFFRVTELPVVPAVGAFYFVFQPGDTYADQYLVGNDGVPVYVGQAAIPGPEGPQGPAGPAGPQGAQGIQGPQGLPGADGAVGPAGPQGIQGPAGNDGAQGIQGPAGPAGPQGLPGADGAQGPQGIQGPAGLDGAVGPAGPQGPQGIQGPAGLDGNDGATGPQGPQGIQGIQGPAGADGAVGPAGPAGADGAPGATGATGPAGEPGADIFAPLLPLAGAFVGNTPNNVLATVAGVANQISVTLFASHYAFTIDQIGCSVSTAVAAAQLRVVIYDVDSNGRPTNLLFVSSAIDASTTGTKLVAASFTFVAGKRYYVGLWQSANATYRSILAYGAPLSWTNAATPLANRSLVFSSAFSPTTDPPAWPTFANGQLASNPAPFVLFRVA